jgi:hypothetical protein
MAIFFQRTASVFLKQAVSIALLLTVSCWPFGSYLFLHVYPLSFDSVTHNFPLRYNAVSELSQGQWPLWNPHIMCGMPLVGDGISNPFDLLNTVFLFLDPEWACLVFIALQLFLSGLFMFIYLQQSLNVGILASLFGGILCVFNPVLTFGPGIRLDFVNPLGSFLWLPLIMLFIDKALCSEENYRRSQYSILAGCCLALSLFGGSVNIVFFMLLFIFLYILCRPNVFPTKLRIAVTVGLVFALASAIQLLPTIETAAQGHRTIAWTPSGLDPTGYNLISLVLAVVNYPFDVLYDKPRALIALMDLYFKLTARFVYLGTFELLLLIVIYSKKIPNASIRAYKIMAVGMPPFLLLIYYLPIKGIIDSLFPLLKGLRYGYTIFLLYFCLIVLVSYSFDNLLKATDTSARVKRIVLILCVMTLGFCGYLLFEFLNIHRLVLSNMEAPRPEIDLLGLTLRIFGIVTALGLPPVLLFVMLRNKPNWQTLPAVVIVVVVSLNLMHLWELEFVRLFSTVPVQHVFRQTQETVFLKSLKPRDRFEVYYGHNIYYATPYWFNVPLFLSASMAGGSHQLMSTRHRTYIDMVNARYPFDPSYYWKNGAYIYPSAYAFLDSKEINEEGLNLLGVKYLLYREKQDRPFLKELFKGDQYFVYENLNALPRAFLVFDSKRMDSETILDTISGNRFNPRLEVLLEDSPGFLPARLPGLSAPTSPGRCEFTEYGPNHVTLSVSAPASGFLVLTDTYAKGWNAYIDGKKTDLLRANYLFRAVPLPEGIHTVRFEYSPLSFLIGAFLSTTTILACAVFMLWPYRRLRNVHHPLGHAAPATEEAGTNR